MQLLDSVSVDQAYGLRLPLSPSPVRVVAVTSGKGGVGKTSVSVNLAVALASGGQRTLLLDADMGLANVDVLLGLTPRFTLADVLEGRCTLDDTILEGPYGVGIVPATSGKQRMADLRPLEYLGLISGFSELQRAVDVLIVDTAAGISSNVLTFAQAAQDVLVVVCNEPASITDAYALIKLLSRERGVNRIQIVANMTRSTSEARHLFDKLVRVTGQFLDVTLNLLGTVPHDEWFRRAIQYQQSVMEAFPSSTSARAFRNLAQNITQWKDPPVPRGAMQFFLERFIPLEA